jgi:hypothetical protein
MRVAALAELATKPEAAPNIAKSEREDNLFRFVFIRIDGGVSIKLFKTRGKDMLWIKRTT